jgi:hypothetical protein
MKFGVLMLYFNAERTISRCIDNCAPFVNTIYISYSPEPFSKYNSRARELHKNQSSLEVVKKSRYSNKIKIIQGVWDSEEDQRNAVVDLARTDGIDYLIVQDPDEFYLPEAYQKNIQGILQQPAYPFYYVPWINFWKNLQTVAVGRENIWGTKKTIYSDCPNFAINLRDFPDLKFVDKRGVNAPYNQCLKLNGLCYHLSYVYSDTELQTKIQTWGHSHQVSANWFYYKWLGFDRNRTRFIHPIAGPSWLKAKKFLGVLPDELKDFPRLDQKSIQLNASERVKEWILDIALLAQYYWAKTKGNIAFALKIGQFKS